MPQKVVCDVCPSGYQMLIPGSTFCEKCPVGRFGNGINKQCYRCNEGMYREGDDPELNACSECPTGWIQPNKDKGLCVVCEAGKYASKTKMDHCEHCLIDTFTSVSGLDKCSDCPRGYTNYFNSSSSCSMCPEGKYGNGNVLGCVICANATSRKEGADPTLCPACIPGQFNPKKGKGRCQICGAGRYQEQYNTTACLLCPTGFSRAAIVSYKETPDVNPTICYPCRAGDTALQKGLSRCSGCVVGKYGYTLETGLLARGGFCKFCKPGQYIDSKGKTECIKCRLDTYVETNGSVARGDCKLCSTSYALHTTTSGKIGVDNKTTGCLCAKGNPKSTNALDKAGYYTEPYPLEELSNPIVADRKFCLSCPSGAACYHDGMSLTDLHAKIGYWRPTKNSTIFSDCSRGIKGSDRINIARKRCCPGESNSDSNGVAAPGLEGPDGFEIKSGECEYFHNSSLTTFNTTDDQCLNGYGGELCLVCDANSVKIGTNCIRCSGKASLRYALIASFCLWILPIMLFIVFRDLCQQHLRHRQQKMLHQKKQKVVPNGVAVTTTDHAIDSNVFYAFAATFVDLGVNEAITTHLKKTKIHTDNPIRKKKVVLFAGQVLHIIQFAQIVHCISVVLDNIPWSSRYASVIVFLGLSNLDLFSLIEILQGHFYSCHLSVSFLERWIIYTSMPFMMLLGVCLSYGFVQCYSRRKTMCKCCLSRSQARYNQLKQDRNSTLLFVWLFIYPSTITRVFGIFRCALIEGVQGWVLESNVEFKCYQGNHWIYIGISIGVLFLFGLGLPLFLFITLCKTKQKKYRDNISYQRTYGFLYTHLDAACWWFIPISMFHTFALVGGLNVVGVRGPGQPLLACLLQLVMLLVILKQAPYNTTTDDRTTLVSSLTIMLILLAGFALFVDIPSLKRPKINFSDMFMTVVLLSLLAAFALFAVASISHILFAEITYKMYLYCCQRCLQMKKKCKKSCERTMSPLSPLCQSPPWLKDEEFDGFPPSTFCPINKCVSIAFYLWGIWRDCVCCWFDFSYEFCFFVMLIIPGT